MKVDRLSWVVQDEDADAVARLAAGVHLLAVEEQGH